MRYLPNPLRDRLSVRCQFQPKRRDGFGPPTAPQSGAGSNERTCTMSGALLQSRFQVEERLAQLLAHLGLDQAHFAARLDNDWTGLVLRRPELVTSLTLVCPVYMHSA